MKLYTDYIWDFDGTLFDSYPHSARALCAAARHFGVTLDEFFQGVAEHNAEYEAMLYDMLRHLAIAVNNIHMTLDCDVILGGFFSEYLQPWLPALKSYVQALNPFYDGPEYVQLSILRRHITPLGAALHFIREFVSSV